MLAVCTWLQNRVFRCQTWSLFITALSKTTSATSTCTLQALSHDPVTQPVTLCTLWSSYCCTLTFVSVSGCINLPSYFFVFVCSHPATYDLIIWSPPRGGFSSLSLYHLLPDEQTILHLLAIHILCHLAEAERCSLPYDTVMVMAYHHGLVRSMANLAWSARVTGAYYKSSMAGIVGQIVQWLCCV